MLPPLARQAAEGCLSGAQCDGRVAQAIVFHTSLFSLPTTLPIESDSSFIPLQERAAILMLRHFSFYCWALFILTTSKSLMRQAVGLFMARSVNDAILACPFEYQPRSRAQRRSSPAASERQ